MNTKELNISEKSLNTGDNILKLIAIVAMVIDHVGNNFYPELIGLRMIGRLVIPIFSYLIAKGIYRTSNPGKYFERILVFAVLAQLPYSMYFGVTNLNIMFTYLISVIFLYGIKNKSYIYSAVALILLSLFDVEGGGYVFLFPVIFYLFRDKQIAILFALGALIAFRYFMFDSFISIFYIFGIILVLIFEKIDFKFKLKLPKYLIYVFYPLHLIVLYLIYNLA